jgi:hypothetical protein
MTEAEWLASTDPARMLSALRHDTSDRKLRLFAVACCRRIWHLMPDEASRVAVETGERFADELASRNDLVAAIVGIESQTYREDVPYRAATAAWHSATVIARRDSARFAASHSAEADEAPAELVRAAIADLLRCVFGNPFRPVTLDPAWRTSTVLGLASAIYAERAFDRLPILADALEDAGCDQPDLLAHCRSDNLHVRGCWAVDLILDKS